MKQSIWSRVPHFTKTGTLNGSIVRIEETSTPGTARLFFKPDGTTPPEVPDDPSVPRPLYEYLYRDELDASGAFQVPLRISDMSTPEGTGGLEIGALLDTLKKGDPITIRTSRTWRGNHLYVRYLKNNRTGAFAGYPEEADWRQAAHPYPPYPETGTDTLLISHIDRITDEDGKTVHTVELSDGGKPPACYRSYILPSSAAAKKLDAMQETVLSGKMVSMDFFYDMSSGYSTILDFDTGSAKKPEAEKKKRERKRTALPYGIQKELAKAYETIPAAEFAATGGIYHARMVTVDGLDYGSRFYFAAFCLEDGRTVMPELRTKFAEGQEGIPTEQNLLFHKERLQPGLPVTLLFTPARRGGYMLLRGIKLREIPEERI